VREIVKRGAKVNFQLAKGHSEAARHIVEHRI
jgi:hypothetical protein